MTECGAAFEVKLSRREIVLGVTSCAISSSYLRAQPTSSPGASQNDFFTPTVPELVELGTNPATEPETAKALALLADAAKEATPFDIMQKLANIKDVNSDGDPYNAGWPSRWNPLIVTFFNATHLQPSGDVTSWCAASLNWCLKQKGYSGTESASSGSFRTAPGRTDNPQPGDIVVFTEGDRRKALQCFGHVGFYVAQDKDTVTTLGGNQVTQARRHSVICVQKIPKHRYLVLQSFHSLSAQLRLPQQPPAHFSCPLT